MQPQNNFVAWVPLTINLKNDQIEDTATSDLFHGNSSSNVRKLPTQILDSAIYKKDILNAATSLDDLRSAPGNRLEALRGDLTQKKLADHLSIPIQRINAFTGCHCI